MANTAEERRKIIIEHIYNSELSAQETDDILEGLKHDFTDMLDGIKRALNKNEETTESLSDAKDYLENLKFTGSIRSSVLLLLKSILILDENFKFVGIQIPEDGTVAHIKKIGELAKNVLEGCDDGILESVSNKIRKADAETQKVLKYVGFKLDDESEEELQFVMKMIYLKGYEDGENK